MSKTITLANDAYELLHSLKEGPDDSISDVIRRHLHKPLDTCGEIADFYDKQPPPIVDLAILRSIRKERTRRSARRN